MVRGSETTRPRSSWLHRSSVGRVPPLPSRADEPSRRPCRCPARGYTRRPHVRFSGSRAGASTILSPVHDPATSCSSLPPRLVPDLRVRGPGRGKSQRRPGTLGPLDGLRPPQRGLCRLPRVEGPASGPPRRAGETPARPHGRLPVLGPFDHALRRVPHGRQGTPPPEGYAHGAGQVRRLPRSRGDEARARGAWGRGNLPRSEARRMHLLPWTAPRNHRFERSPLAHEPREDPRDLRRMPR
jgi:hypothetical protein